MATMRPFMTFNFRVEIDVEGISDEVCKAEFAEVEGLEMTIEKKTIREGGNNARQIHLSGPVSYGSLTLRRGMTRNLDLFRWIQRATSAAGMRERSDAHVVMLDRDGHREVATIYLERCLPTRFKIPSLNASNAAVAIEELEVAYESFRIESDADSLVAAATGRAGTSALVPGVGPFVRGGVR